MRPSLGERHYLAHPPPRSEEVTYFLHHAAEPLRRVKVVEAQGRIIASLDPTMILLDAIGRTGNRLMLHLWPQHLRDRPRVAGQAIGHY